MKILAADDEILALEMMTDAIRQLQVIMSLPGMLWKCTPAVIF